MDGICIESLRTLCHTDKVKWTIHVLNRMRERRISSDAILNAVLSGEIIKQYQDDKPFPSCLIFNKDFAAPLHIVASTDKRNVYVITVYIPTLDDWEADYRTRKEL